MQCKEVLDSLSRYTEAESDEYETVEIRRHLDGCPSCRRVAESLSALQTVMSDSLHEDMPYPDLSKVVMSKLPAPKPIFRYVWAVAAAVLVFAAVLMFTHRRPVHRTIGVVAKIPPIQKPADISKPVAPKPPVRPRSIPPAPQKVVARIHSHPAEHRRVRIAKVRPSAGNHIRITMDISPSVSADNSSGVRAVTTMEAGDVSFTREQTQTTVQEAPLPDAEKIERPALEQAMASSIPMHAM